MSSDNLKYVKTEISGKAAQAILTKRKWFEIRKSLLKRIELVYLPHYFFHLKLSLKSGEKKVVASTDGILGTFALADEVTFELAEPVAGEKFAFQVPLSEAEKICLDEYRKLILGFGLRQREFAVLKSIETTEHVMYPFWVAYFKFGEKYDFKAVDAISGKLQGVKMRKVFLTAFSQSTTALPGIKNEIISC